MVVSGDETLAAWLSERSSPETLAQVEDICHALRRKIARPVAYVVNEARQRVAARLGAGVTSRNRHGAERPRALRRHLETLSTHRFWGLPLLAGVLYLTYQFVGVLGADILVGLFEERLFGELINPAAVALAERTIPWAFLRDLLIGPYGVITMALTYSVALVLPIVGTFFIAFGLLEDSGYLPRLAVMVNRGFQRMGLNGKAILPMVLGLGCDTMATLTTRVLETPKERLVVIILLALGVPCSAQLAVILALLSPLPAAALAIWLGVVLGVIVLVGRLASRFLPGRGSDFVLELPPIRAPRLGNIVVKTLARIEWYLKEAVPLFVLGTLILFFADHFRLLGSIESLAEPVVSGLLGLPAATAPAFIIGFLRRDFGAAGLFQMAQEGVLDPLQVLVAAVTITLFIPCIANVFMIVKERGWRTALAVAAFILPFALAVGAALNWTLRALPWTLV
jgi:ferrous iron transport protein B